MPFSSFKDAEDYAKDKAKNLRDPDLERIDIHHVAHGPNAGYHVNHNENSGGHRWLSRQPGHSHVASVKAVNSGTETKMHNFQAKTESAEVTDQQHHKTVMKTVRKLREDGTPAGGAPGMSSPANVTGDSPNMAMPPSMVPGPVIRRKYRQFDLEPETFRKFEKGKMKFERWSRFLDLKNENHKAIYDYAYNNRGKEHLIVIRDSSTGALRAIRRRPHNGE